MMINDFEFFTNGAAKRLKIPVISLNHQQVVTETRYTISIDHWYDAFFTAFLIKIIAPRHPRHIIVSSFFYPPIKKPIRTSLIPPIIRHEVLSLIPQPGDPILVYFNHPQGAEHILNVLTQVSADFIIYNFPAPEDKSRYSNLVFKKPSTDGFLKDLASCRGIICTAGFTLISEALYLKKPLLAIPNIGIFEQTLNAFFLQKYGLGDAIINRPLGTDDVIRFLNHIPLIRTRLNRHMKVGNEDAVSIIENILHRLRPETYAVRKKIQARAAEFATKSEHTAL
jgi:uncharacterized protein (TIGR00661 family)